MRKTKKKLAARAVDQPLLHEEEDLLRAGDVVMLPDGALAAVEKVVGADAYVIEWHKQIGRGPWIFPVSDLVLV